MRILTRVILTGIVLLAGCGAPKWKTERAAEVRKEVLSFIGYNPKTIYIRDFDRDDSDFEAYIEPENGEPEVLGCAFHPSESPHCWWHQFGTVTIESVRADAMAKPYKLFPDGR
jgi:hypothetical protein